MNRRGFLGSILAAATAPAIVRADSLMRIVPRDEWIYRPRVISAGALFPSPTFTGRVVINKAYWSTDGKTWNESKDGVIVVPGHQLGADGVIEIRSELHR